MTTNFMAKNKETLTYTYRRARVGLEYGAPLTAVLGLAAALVAAGAGMVFLPAGLVVGGLLLAALGAVCIDVEKGGG